MPTADDVKVKVVAFVLTLVMLIIVLNLTPVFIDAATLDTTYWGEGTESRGANGHLYTNFTGATASKTLIGLLPLIVVIIVFVAITVSLFEDLL